MFFAVLVYNLNAQVSIIINSGNYYYTPTNLTVNVGDTVTWINDGGLHNVNGDFNYHWIEVLTILRVLLHLQLLRTNTIYTCIYYNRSYEYDCSVGSHAQNGMVGYITVNSPPILDCNGVS